MIESRQIDPRWAVPNRSVEPASQSRMYLAAEQDCAPKPLDDQAAKRFMDRPNCIDNSGYYNEIPTRANTENPQWLEYLPTNLSGEVQLSQPLAIDLALIHSRDYQTQYENVYLTALQLSGNRFEFDAQWFGGLGAGFTATGEDLGDQRALSVTANRLGFSRQLAGGGQFATSVINSLFWDFGSSGIQAGSAAVVTTFTQPLLRGAFRHVRLENLTQAERNLLYAVRDFARFRRLFYVDTTTSYLNLLTRIQAIRNLEANVENLSRNLEEYRLLVSLERASPIQADQVFQDYQNGRLRLLSARQSLVESTDDFKFQLGLPSWVPMEFDETMLKDFELVDPKLEVLQSEAQELYQSLSQYISGDFAPRNELMKAFDRLIEVRSQARAVLPNVVGEYERWKSRLDATDIEALAEEDQLDVQQQRAVAIGVERILTELQRSFDNSAAREAVLREKLATYPTEPPEKVVPRGDLSVAEMLGTGTFDDIRVADVVPKSVVDPTQQILEALQEEVGDNLRNQVAELFIAQTQSRVFLINIDPQPIQEQAAITYALQNRLDLMNSQAAVMDSFRRVEVAADALEADLSVTGGVAIGSDPDKNNAFRLDSSANRYSVGVELDGPLNRLNERNTYRAAQIEYQRAGRNFIADRDRVANEIRSILRQLELSRLNFQIARQQLVTATRQVDQAQIDLSTTREANSNVTLFLLEALQGLLDSKNNLISNWVQYRIQKMRLFTALEMLYIDESGTWLNEESGLEQLASFQAIDAEYFPIRLDDFGPARQPGSLRPEQPTLPGKPTLPSQEEILDQLTTEGSAPVIPEPVPPLELIESVSPN